jgi:rRNA-processing protein FCF1
MRCNVVVIDANFIFLPIQFKIDYFREINDLLVGKTYFLIYKQIFDELESKR